MNSAAVIPTGNEILHGIVTDTNSPAIMALLIEAWPHCEVIRTKPVLDLEIEIIRAVKGCVEKQVDLIILTGGSGGGHRFDSSLAPDHTHHSILKYVEETQCCEIYGKNGHMWSKIVVGKKASSYIVTVPGPYAEAIEAVKACLRFFLKGKSDLKELSDCIVEAVVLQYPAAPFES